MGGVVGGGAEGGVVARGDDLDAVALTERRREVPKLAVDPDSERRPGEALADGAGGVGAAGAVGELELGAVGEVDLHGTCKVPAGARGLLVLKRLDPPPP